MSHIECRSKKILKKPESSFNRSVFKSMGFSNKDLEKPIVGIANAWSELVPGHYNLRQLAEAVRGGILAAGGTPAVFAEWMRIAKESGEAVFGRSPNIKPAGSASIRSLPSRQAEEQSLKSNQYSRNLGGAL